MAVSVPLVVEYEATLGRHLRGTGLTTEDVGAFLDFVCAIAKRQKIFFLWRPLLRDPKDDMVVELAVAAGCSAIITHNRRDFTEAERLGLKVLSPGEFLKTIGGPP